jgi:hypothetical protein
VAGTPRNVRTLHTGGAARGSLAAVPRPRKAGRHAARTAAPPAKPYAMRVRGPRRSRLQGRALPTGRAPA